MSAGRQQRYIRAGRPADHYAREMIPFRATVPAGWSGYLLARPAGEATIEEVRVRIYPGPECSVRIRPVLRRDDEEEALFRFARIGPDCPAGASAKTWIDGDDDVWVFPLCRAVIPTDEIRVYIENPSAYVYDIAVDVMLDYAGGQYPAAVAAFAGVSRRG